MSLEDNTEPKILTKSNGVTKKASLPHRENNNNNISSSDSSISIVSNDDTNTRKNKKGRKLKYCEADSDKTICQKYHESVSKKIPAVKITTGHHLSERQEICNSLEYDFRKNPTRMPRLHSGPAPYRPFQTINSAPLVTTKGYQPTNCSKLRICF